MCYHHILLTSVVKVEAILQVSEKLILMKNEKSYFTIFSDVQTTPYGSQKAQFNTTKGRKDPNKGRPTQEKAQPGFKRLYFRASRIAEPRE